MVEYWQKIQRGYRTMDRKARATLAVSSVLIAALFVLALFGEQWIALDRAGLESFMTDAARSPWALLAVIVIFSLLAFVSFPQFLLIAATVFAFGAETGAIYSWTATMISATVTFLLGRSLGGPWVARMGGDRSQSIVRFVGRHGAIASGLVRVVPSAPFIVVNAAAGAAKIALWKFWLGTGVGIVPKIILVAFLGAMAPDAKVLSRGVDGLRGFWANLGPMDYVAAAAAIVAWVVLMLGARRLYRRLREPGGAT